MRMNVALVLTLRDYGRRWLLLCPARRTKEFNFLLGLYDKQLLYPLKELDV